MHSNQLPTTYSLDIIIRLLIAPLHPTLLFRIASLYYSESPQIVSGESAQLIIPGNCNNLFTTSAFQYTPFKFPNPNAGATWIIDVKYASKLLKSTVIREISTKYAYFKDQIGFKI